MADRPILFSAPMIRALLAGRKTQTRRVLKPQPDHHYFRPVLISGRWYDDAVDGGPALTRYETGDRLWVKEAHAFVGGSDPGLLVTRADYPNCVPRRFESVPPAEQIRWRSPIHMSRWASRITLTVTDVKVERLQDISAADAVAEGTPCYVCGRVMDGLGETDCHCFHSKADANDYRDLWNSLHGPDAWAANPWVAAISFTVEQRNIDAREAA